MQSEHTAKSIDNNIHHSKDDVRQWIIIGAGLGVVIAIVYRLILPSQIEQLVRTFIPSSSVLPAIFPRLLIVTAILSLLGGLVLKYQTKVRYPFRSVVYVSIMAQSFTITVLGQRTLGNSFIFILPFTYTGAQIVWSYAIKRKNTQAIYLIVLITLVILALRTLNTGKLGLVGGF